MGHPCYRLLPNIRKPIPHIVSVVPVRPLLQCNHSVLRYGQSHLRGRAVLAGPNIRSIQCILQDTKQGCPPVDEFFDVEMTVRDCELDKYGVVGHAVIVEYIDKGREVFASFCGVHTDSIAESGRALAHSELNIKYFAPLKGGSKFVVQSRVAKTKGVRVFLEHVIKTLPDRNVVVKATATVVCLDGNYRPTRVFPELSSKLQCLSSDDADVF